ncbi:MAG: hypothetical protein LLF99_06525 [Desulfobacteraceae bacterium]|nr:hypothetical protein [Desulfobacteraceae bacterium]
MECSRVKVILLENTDTVLPEDVRTAVEAHLAECRSCADLREALGEQAHALGALPRIKAPEDLLERVRREVEKTSPVKILVEKFEAIFGSRHFFRLAATAAVALIVFGTLRVGMQDKAPQDLSTTAPPPSALREPTAKQADVQGPGESPQSKAVGRDTNAPTPVPAPAALPHESSSAPDARQESITLTLRLPMAPARTKAREAARPSAVPPARGLTAPEREAAEHPADAPRAGSVSKSARSKGLQEERFEPASPDRGSIRSEIRRLVLEADGTVLETGSPDGTVHPAEVTAELPAENFAFFLGRLRELGTIETARKDQFHPAPGTRIRITLKLAVP